MKRNVPGQTVVRRFVLLEWHAVSPSVPHFDRVGIGSDDWRATSIIDAAVVATAEDGLAN